MSAPMPFVTGECEEDGSRVLSAAGAAEVASFINGCITDGMPPDVRLEQLSPHDFDASRFVPAHRPGVRWFFVGLDPAGEREHALGVVLGVSDDPGSDYVRLPLSRLMPNVGRIEYQGCAMRDLASDLAAANTRRTLLGQCGREAAKELAGNEREMNAACDDIRAMVADQCTWAPIEPTAHFFGTVAAYKGSCA